MTAAIHNFPAPPEFVALMQAREKRVAIVAAANDILDNQQRHDDAAIKDACIALCGFGAGYDQLRGETEMYLLNLRQRRQMHNAARREVAPQPTGRIRRALGVLAGAVAFVAVGWAALAGVML